MRSGDFLFLPAFPCWGYPVMLRFVFPLSLSIFLMPVAAGLALTGTGTLQGSEQGTVASIEDDTVALTRVLTSDAPVYDKAKACQRLAIVGDGRSAAALAPLIDHPQLSDYALTALLRISATESDAVLVDAISQSKGRPLIGLLGVIGQRGLDSAVDEIEALWSRSPPLEPSELQASYRALGNIGSERAAELLRKQSRELDAVTSRALRDARLRAKQKRSTGDGGAANRARLSRLTSSPADFDAALQAARQIGSTASGPIARQLPKISSPQRLGLVLICLGDLGNENAVDAARDFLIFEDNEVVLRATEAVARLGGFDRATEIPSELLENKSLRDDLESITAVMVAMASVGNESIDRQVIGKLSAWADGTGSGVDSNVKIAHCRYAEERRLAAATKPLMSLSRSVDRELREAALRAAGLTVTSGQFGELIDQLTSADADSEVASETLRRALVHLPQDEAASIIQQKIRNTSGQTRSMLIGQLAFLGGPKALAVVVEAASSSDDAAVDAATRALGQWMTSDVAEPMLMLATKLPAGGKYQIRALRGYLRVGRQLDVPTAARIELCNNALQLAQRDDERLLVLDILARYPSRQAMDFLVDQLGGDSFSGKRLKNRAYATLVRVAERVALRDPNAVSAALSRLDLSAAPESARSELQKHQ